MTDDTPDYASIELPDDTPKSEWSVSERRAHVFHVLRELPVPTEFNQTAHANEFDISTSAAHRDVNAVAEQLVATPEPRLDHYTLSVFEDAIENLRAEGEWYKAAKVNAKRSKWLLNRGITEKAAEKKDVNLFHEDAETDAIRVVNSNGEVLGSDGDGEW